MWGRALQIAAAGWLVLTPMLLGDDPAGARAVAVNTACAAAIALLAAASFHRKLPHVHLATVLPGFWLLGEAFFRASYPAPPLHQSNIIVSLLLLILALVPSNANEPPRSWAAFNGRYEQGKS